MFLSFQSAVQCFFITVYVVIYILDRIIFKDSLEIQNSLKMAVMEDVITLTDSKLSSLRDAGKLCDLVIQVQDGENSSVHFPAHKIIVVASMPYFYSLYAANILEDVITLPACVEPLSFSIILDFIYYQPLTLRSLQSRLDHEGVAAYWSFSLALEKLIATSSFLGLASLSERLTVWSRTCSQLSSDGLTQIKLELDQDNDDEGTKFLPVEFQNDAYTHGHQPLGIAKIENETDIKRDCSSSEEEAFRNDVVSIEKMNVSRPRGRKRASADDVMVGKQRGCQKRKLSQVKRGEVRRKGCEATAHRRLYSRDLFDSSMSVHHR